MELPLKLDGNTVRDATGRVIMSALNPCTIYERRLIVYAVNGPSTPGHESVMDILREIRQECYNKQGQTCFGVNAVRVYCDRIEDAFRRLTKPTK